MAKIQIWNNYMSKYNKYYLTRYEINIFVL